MRKDSIKINFIYNVLLKVVSLLIPLITAPYLARVLTPEGVGDYSYSLSIASYFVLLISFGFTDYGTQEISKYRDEKDKYSYSFWNVVFLRIILLIVSIFIYVMLVYKDLFGDSPEKIVFIAFLPLLVGTGLDVTFLFQGLECLKVVSLITVMAKIISVILIFVFVHSKSDLLIYVIIQSSVTLFVSLLSWYYIRKTISWPHDFKLNLKDALGGAFVYFLPTVAVSLYTVVDRTMIGVLSTKVELAYYQQAYRIEEIPCNIVNAISPIMLSRIVYLSGENNEQEIKTKTKQVFELMAIIICPSIAGLYLVSDRFVPFYFGNDYYPAISVLYILIPQIIITTLSNNIRNIYYAPRKKLSLLTFILFIGASINLLLNSFMIVKWGANGAAIASLISELFICIMIMVFSCKDIDYFTFFIALRKPALASILMCLFVLFLNMIFDMLSITSFWVILFDCILGGGVYCFLCLKFKIDILRNLTVRHKIIKFK